MKFSVDPQVVSRFPGVRIGIVTLYDMVNDRKVHEILDLLRQEESRQQTELSGTELGSLPEIAAWRRIYREFGSSKEFRSSVESLVRRARAGNKPLPDISPLVNLYNYLSLKYRLPAGAEDLDRVEGDIRLCIADGTEAGTALGFETPETPEPGEVIYRDDAGFLCRKWNWREADRTKITPETTRAVAVLEQAPGIDPGVLDTALSELSALGSRYLGGKCAIMLLDRDYPSVTL